MNDYFYCLVDHTPILILSKLIQGFLKEIGFCFFFLKNNFIRPILCYITVVFHIRCFFLVSRYLRFTKRSMLLTHFIFIANHGPCLGKSSPKPSKTFGPAQVLSVNTALTLTETEQYYQILVPLSKTSLHLK